MMIFRSGSTNTAYGDGSGRYIYPATHLIEKTIELLLESVEEFGRPIPKVYMPRATEALTKPERESIRAYARAVHSRFIEIPTNESRATIEMDAAVVSSGQLGAREMAIIEMLVTWIYIRILRVAQTMNKTGGSRALEDTRYEITDDASRPICSLIDDSLNAASVVGDEYTGWMADYNDFNHPNEPEEILPRFETPTLSQENISKIHDRVMDAIDHGIGDDISKDYYLRVTGAEKAKNDQDRLGGTPVVKATTKKKSSRSDEEPQSLATVAARANDMARELDRLVQLAA
jgi:hypothetical protein